MAFRFIHTADLHLDSPLKSLALADPDLAEAVGTATRQAYDRIVQLCLDERVDALLIAGDAFDGDQTSMKTGAHFAAGLARLAEAGVRVFLIRGNHDAQARVTKAMVLPDGVKVFGGRDNPEAIEGACGGRDVIVHGVSFAQPHAPDSLLGKFRAPEPGSVNIGLLHTSLGGAEGHDNYAPCTPTELAAHGYDYWALGHIHRRSVQTLTSAPSNGLAGSGQPATIVMPGIPQGRDIGESGPKSVTLATIADDGSVSLSERAVAPAEFARVGVDLTDAAEWPAAVAALHGALDTARAASSAEHLVVRVELSGVTPLAWRLRRDADVLTAEARRQGEMHAFGDLAVGKTWIEGITMACRRPAASMADRAGASEAAGDPVEGLAALIRADIAGSLSFRNEAEALVDDLVRDLPAAARPMLGATEAERAALVERLVDAAVEDVLAHLSGDARPSADTTEAD